MPCFSGDKGGLDRFKISHLPDKNNIRVLPEGGPQRLAEGFGVVAYLPLVYDRSFVPVKVLNGVLYSHDMICSVAVYVVDHRSKRSRLTASGSTGNKDKSTRFKRDLLDNLRQSQFFYGWDSHRNYPEHK